MNKELEEQANKVFKQVLVDLGFANYLPSQMSNSDYWMCTCTAMVKFTQSNEVEMKERIKELEDKIYHYPSDSEITKYTYDLSVGNSEYDQAFIDGAIWIRSQFELKDSQLQQAQTELKELREFLAKSFIDPLTGLCYHFMEPALSKEVCYNIEQLLSNK